MASNYSVIPKTNVVELQPRNRSTSSERSSISSSEPASLRLDPVNGHFISHNSIDLYGERDPIFPHHHRSDDYSDELDGLMNDEVGGGSGSGVPSAVFNLTTTIVGAGIMALPATLKVLGLIPGFILIVVMGIISEISVEMLVRFAVLCNAKSYGEVVGHAFGYKGKVISEICIVVYNIGFLVAYLIIIGDVLSGSVEHEGVFDQLIGDGGFWDQRKIVILVVLVVFLGPLCALKKIESLSLTSAASVGLAVVFVVVTCAITLVKLFQGRIDDSPRMFPDFSSRTSNLDLLVVIPIMTNAYVCHYNVLPIYNELKGRSPQKMNRVGRITTVICVSVYALTAISGYVLFGDLTDPDVLTNFDIDLGIPYSSTLNYIVRIGYILHLVPVFPVLHFSLRGTVNSLLFKNSTPLSESKERFMGLTVVLLILVYIVSTMIPNIWIAFKFTGATTAVTLGFIFPSLVSLRLSKEGERLTQSEKILSLAMLVMAVSVGVIGIVGNIYGLSGKS